MRNSRVGLTSLCVVLVLILSGVNVSSSIAATTKTPVPSRTPKPTLTPTLAPVVGTLVVVGTANGSGPTAGGNSIYVVDTNGKNRKIIKDYGDFTDFQFNKIQWSPDGNYFAFFGGQPPVLNVSNADGSDIRQASYYNLFAWSPDGKQLTSAAPSGSSMLSVFNVDPGTGKQTQLFNVKTDLAYIDYLRWSPDGTRLLYLGTPADGAVDGEEIHIVNADGSNDQIVVPAGTLARTATWSPDGKKIGYIGAGGKVGTGLFVLDLTSNKATKVIPTAVAADWSPDGSQFAYVTSSGQLFTANADGSKPHMVAKPAGVKGGIAAVSWRPPVQAETPVEATAAATTAS